MTTKPVGADGASAPGTPPAPPARGEALRRLFDTLPAGQARSETVALGSALGRVLAEDLAAPHDVPPFARSSMDGYAVHAADLAGAFPGAPVRLRVAAEVRMGSGADEPLPSGYAAPVPTGGMLPPGADAVVPIEDTVAGADAGAKADGTAAKVAAARPSGREPANIVPARQIAFPSAASAGQHITPQGADLQAGGPLLPAGRRLRPQDVAALAATGVLAVPVSVPPRVAILGTGDELVPADETPGPGQIREFNSWGLAAAVQQDGGRAARPPFLPDEPEAQEAAMRAALDAHDMVLIVGGSSVGRRDWTARVLARLPGPGILVHGIALKPGRPTILAVLADSRGQLKPVFGLPGHPVSCFVVYEALVRPTLARLLGEVPPPPSALRARAGQAFRSGGLETWVRVELVPDAHGDPPWVARSIPGDSAILSTLTRAHGILRLRPHAVVEVDEPVDVELFMR